MSDNYELARGSEAAAINLIELQRDGRCRYEVGVWGNQRCPELAVHVHCRNCPVYARIGRQLLDRVPAVDGLAAHATLSSRTELATGRSIIVFRVGAEWLALPTGLAREVVAPLRPHRVPHRNDPRFLGIVNVRGELLPCVDLRVMLGVTGSGTGRSPSRDKLAAQSDRDWARLLIIERDQAAWAVPVAAVDGVRRVAEDELVAPPVTIELGSPCFTAAVVELPVGRVGLIDEELLWYALTEVCQ